MEDAKSGLRGRPARRPALDRRALAGSLLLAVLAVGLGGCGPYLGTTAASFLRRVRTDPDPNLRYAAYMKLADPNCFDSDAQKDEAVKTLVGKLENGFEPVATRAVIINTLGDLRRPGARDAVRKAIVESEETVVRVQACRALGKVGKPEDATVLARVMATDTFEDCRIAAIEALGELKANDPRITRVLVLGMQHDDPATRLASLNALRAITGKDLGIEPEPWVKLLTPDLAPKALIAGKAGAPGLKDPATVTASATGTVPEGVLHPRSRPSPNTTPSSGSSYPPRLNPMLDPLVGEDGAAGGNRPLRIRADAPPPMTTKPVADGDYPTSNPNLQPPSAPR